MVVCMPTIPATWEAEAEASHGQKYKTLPKKQTKNDGMKTKRVSQVVKPLSSKSEVLSSTLNTTTTNNKNLCKF
jgi:hypothetical protein